MQRKVVVLRHWLGLSVRETAHELGIGEGTVKSHSSRGLERLEAVLAARRSADPPQSVDESPAPGVVAGQVGVLARPRCASRSRRPRWR